MEKNNYPDKAGMAMILFGLLLCSLSFYFRHLWLCLLGIGWISIPLLLTQNDEEDED